MINRNRNSAVARAQAEMKQAVNSSRRSANRLNSSRYTKDKMIKAMEAAGYWYDDIDSQYDNCVVFRTEYGSVSFDNFNKVADWLDGVVFDDPAVAEEVYAILNSNCRVNSSRRPSLKTRKAVEYSINCARRRARLNCGWKMYPTAETAVVPAEMMRVSATNNYIPADDIVLTATADNKAIEITCGDIHNIIKIVPQEESMYNAVYKINGRSITAINGAKGLVGSIDQAVNGENNGVNINLLMYCMLYNFAPDWKAEYDHRYDK